MIRRSLTLKWLATLLLTSLVGVLLVGLFARQTTLTEFDRLRIDQAETTFVRDVTAYYERFQTWEGLEDGLRDLYPYLPLGIRPDAPSLFALADSSGRIVLPAGPFRLGQLATAQQLAPGLAVEVAGERVATALLVLPPPDLDPREQRYIDATNRALLIGALGAAAAALLIGLLLSRGFLSPLAELTQAISAMKRGDLRQRVPVRTRDELGELAEAFNAMSAQIHHAHELRRQMTADIAHELRTPLMVISGYLEALCDGTLKPTPARFEAMNQEVLQLRRLIDDLRTLSLADAGELKLHLQTIQPREILEQLARSFEPLAQEQQIVLHLDLPESLPSIRADRERLVQVLSNLISNALRHTPAGGCITLATQAQQDQVQLVVQDTGVGIAPAHQPYVFERFYRIEESRYAAEGESGLGLAIAKSIVEAHQGSIAVQSALGVGTTMRITLPAVPPVVAEDASHL